MSTNRTALYTTVMFCFLGCVLACPDVRAEDLTKHEKIPKVLRDDFDGDGSIDTVILKQLGPNNDVFSLNVKSKGKIFTIQNVLTNDLITNIDYCGLEKIMVSKKFRPFIGISYACGAHSWCLKLYSFNGGHIHKEKEFGSDRPYVAVTDIDEDGQNEIVTADRDWDSNPVEKNIVEKFKFDGQKWNIVQN